MSGDFLDTNVFIYLFDEKAHGKRKVAEEIVNRALSDGTAVISHQVVQETLNVLTRKLAHPIAPGDAKRFLEAVLAPLWRAMPTAALYAKALDLQSRWRYSFYDALILAAALSQGCDRLYSEDLQDGQAVEGLRIVNPFSAA
jgi:predicted nucleic acid-binding protein